MVTLPNLLGFIERYSDSVVILKKMSSSSLSSLLSLHSTLAQLRPNCHVVLHSEKDFLCGVQDWLELDSGGGVGVGYVTLDILGAGGELSPSTSLSKTS